MRKLFSILFTVLMVAFACAGLSRAQEVQYPQPQGFVNDFANVMSPDARAQISALCAEIERKTSAEVVVVTVETTSPLTVEQYAVELFAKWGIGKAGEDNGLLILLAVRDRKVRIEVGYGLEGAVTDLQSKVIIQDLMIPAFRKGGYDLGISSGVVMIAKLVRDEYGVELEMPEVKTAAVPSRGARSPLGSLLMLLFFILIFGFRFGALFFLMSGGGYWSGGGRGSFGGGFGGFGGGMSGGGGASGSW
ncbi:MAG: YgcG family protein [Candidatus Omnitrophica bacterium]|nr:YgcG family protein [Candidatus Omnitrophota bacterium]